MEKASTGEHQVTVMEPGKPMIQNGEYILRMDFLYKAAELLKNSPDTLLLQRHYVVEARNISKRQVLRIDPALKRNQCRRCGTPLDSHKVRLRKKKLISQCGFCCSESQSFHAACILINEEK